MKNIEQLTLIFMNTFDLTIKHRQRIEDDAIALSDQLAERGFVGKFNGPDIINNSSIIGQGFPDWTARVNRLATLPQLVGAKILPARG